jgi:RNA polymerase sigma-70 factor (ECF subfamily)
MIAREEKMEHLLKDPGPEPAPVDAVGLKDSDTLVRLLLSHRAAILGYVGSIVHDPHLAEDVFQEIALVVLRKGSALRSPSDFPVWVRKIARLEALSASRRLHRHPQPFDTNLLDLLDREWSASEPAEPSPRIEALRTCLERLSPQARELVELRYGKNLSGQTLADHRSQARNTVYVALTRIHQALLSCIRSKVSTWGASRA